MLLRAIPLSLNGALKMLGGLAVAIVPIALGIGAPAIIFAIFLGTVMIGLALGASAPGGTDAVPASAQASYDRLLAAALLATGIGAGIAGNLPAFLFFGAVAAAYAALIATTRYVPSAR
jgi:hypothetical protein